MNYNCLKGWIGVSYNGAPPSGSGVYINQLPGVSLKSMQYITNEDQITFLQMFSEVETRSLTTLKTEVINYFARKYQLVPINEAMRMPDYVNVASGYTSAPSQQYRGFTFDQGWNGSDLAGIHIEDLKIFAIAPATTEIVVIDIYSSFEGVVIDTIPVTLVAGWNVVKVRKTYTDTGSPGLQPLGPFKIFVGYDCTAITTPWMPLNNIMNGGPWYDLQNIAWVPLSPFQGILRGATWNKTGTNNLTEMNNLNGLGGSVGTNCSWEPILCNNRGIFTSVLWYLMGRELMIERMFSDRLNRFTTIDLKRAEQLKDYFDTMFQKEMQAVFDGIDPTTWDACVKCSAPYQLAHSLP